MYKIFTAIAIFLFASSISFAQQTSGGSGDAGLKDVCEMSGGSWTGSEGGNWACCWADWGCYGCVDGNCKMQCRTQRCRRANGVSRVGAGEQSVPNLAPKGMKAPIVPMKKSMHEMNNHPTPMQSN